MLLLFPRRSGARIVLDDKPNNAGFAIQRYPGGRCLHIYKLVLAGLPSEWGKHSIFLEEGRYF